MKNKKLGKILLCTTLALATPFALVGCGNKANNNENPDNNEEQQEQQEQKTETQETSLAITYAKNYEGAYASYKKNDFKSAAEMQTGLVMMMGGYNEVPTMPETEVEEPESVSEPDEPVEPSADDFDDDASYQAALEEYQNDLAAYQAALAEYEEYLEAKAAYEAYERAVSEYQGYVVSNYMIGQLIGDNARPTESSIYAISVPETAIKDYDASHTFTIEAEEEGDTPVAYTGLAAYYQDYIKAYLAKYAADENWTEIPNADGNAYYTTTNERDIMVSYDLDSQESKTITIIVMSFNKDSIANAFQKMMTGVEIPNALNYTGVIDEANSIMTDNTLTVEQVKTVMLEEVMVGIENPSLDGVIADEDIKADSAKYTIAMPTELASSASLFGFEYMMHYADNDSEWVAVNYNGLFAQTFVGVFYNQTADGDVLVQIKMSDDNKNIIVSVLSFEKGGLDTFMATYNSVNINDAKKYDVTRVKGMYSSNATDISDVTNALKTIILGANAEGELAAAFDSIDGTIVPNPEASVKYVITVPAGTDFETACTAYSAKYDIDNTWTNMNTNDIAKDAEGIYYTTVTGEKDVLMSVEYNSEESSIIIYVLEFAEGAIENMLNSMN